MGSNVSLEHIQALTGENGTAPIRVAMDHVQVLLGPGAATDRTSLYQLQALFGPGAAAISAALYQIQVLVPVYEPPPVNVFPQLVGQGWNVVKRPIWGNSVATAASGLEVITGYYQWPIWEFELTWDILNDEQTPASTTASDFRNLIGFYNQMNGNLFKFAYQDPDDNMVVGGSLGFGDGSTQTFVLTRYFGGADFGLSEPIGLLNQSDSVAFNVYVAGTLISPSGYSVNTSQPLNQQLTFASAPAVGAAITVDMSWYFWCRFLDGQYDFEKFADKRWMQRKITLHSQRN